MILGQKEMEYQVKLRIPSPPTLEQKRKRIHAIYECFRNIDKADAENVLVKNIGDRTIGQSFKLK